MEILNKEELETFSRQIILSEIGEMGQLKLKNAKVLVVGAGGLGCPVLLYLAAAGIGTLGIADFDIVSRSNLHRQILYSYQDIDLKKAIVAAQKLKLINQNSNFQVFEDGINENNIETILPHFDIIIDCTDNFETRYLLDNFCEFHKKPLVYASIFKFEGQLTVFHLNENCGLKNLYPNKNDEIPTCDSSGVLGIHTGILGLLQANETIKIILGLENVLSGKVLNYNFLTNEQFIFQYQTVIKKIKYKIIYLQDFLELQTLQSDIQLIDVRTKAEYLQENFGGISIANDDFEQNINQIQFNKDIYLYCQTGNRSISFVKKLVEKRFEKNIFIIKAH